MKYSLLFAFALAIGLSSCFEHTEMDRSEVRANLMQEGLWSITYLVDDGRDETANFEQVFLRFESNDRVTAIVNGTEVQGSWNISRADGAGFELDMEFPENHSLLYNLDEDWYVLEMNPDEMRFGEEDDYCGYDDEDESSDEEYLTLTRLNEFN